MSRRTTLPRHVTQRHGHVRAIHGRTSALERKELSTGKEVPFEEVPFEEVPFEEVPFRSRKEGTFQARLRVSIVDEKVAYSRRE